MSLDLIDAYLHIPLRPAHRKFMRLAVGDHHFQFASMCFGLAPAPRVFTKVMVEIWAYMWRQGERMFQYLNDWLLISADKEKLRRQRKDLIRLTKRLGLLINVSKSEQVPSQEAVYLGDQLFLHWGEVGLSAQDPAARSGADGDVGMCSAGVLSVSRNSSIVHLHSTLGEVAHAASPIVSAGVV